RISDIIQQLDKQVIQFRTVADKVRRNKELMERVTMSIQEANWQLKLKEIGPVKAQRIVENVLRGGKFDGSEVELASAAKEVLEAASLKLSGDVLPRPVQPWIEPPWPGGKGIRPPGLKGSEFKMPKMEMPKMEVPKWEIPKIKLPE